MSEKVFITGVSSGLGHGLAKKYLDRGATVYGCSRRQPDDLVAAGLRFISLDLANEPETRPKLEKFIQDIEELNLIVLNAAKLGEIRDMADTPLNDLRETMEINVWANKWILDALFSGDRSVKQVVGISSGASLSGSRGWNGYSLSKAALNMLIKLYAGERSDTHFTSFAPGLVDTAMQDYLTKLPEDDRYKPLEVLKSAKGTENMPDGQTCAEMLIEAFPKLLARPSGEYADIRKI